VTFDVPFELARLRAESGYHLEGHAGRTLTKYPDIRVVLEAMKPGARMTLHETAERVTIQVVVGQIRVELLTGESCDLSDGGFGAIERGRLHQIECREECAFLLTLAWPPRRDDPDPIDV
jgi:quercetin dioxygenase-like cupin family protein